MTDLEIFGFGYNELTGTIPDCIGNLTGLTTFGVSSNYLEGTIPLSFNRLSNLQTLDIANNTFQGSFPEQWLGAAPFVRLVALYDNQFTGTLPDAELPELAGLYSSGNFLNGTLPSWAMSTQLHSLSLFLNAFTGTIPSSLPLFPSFVSKTRQSAVDCLAATAHAHLLSSSKYIS